MPVAGAPFRKDQTCAGAVIVEAVIVALLVVFILAFVFGVGVALDEETNLRDTNYALSRHLAASLGTAWKTGKIYDSPWNGSCNAYLRAAGKTFLQGRVLEHSIDNASAAYYFGDTLDNNTALITDADAPYAILRITGRTGALRALRLNRWSPALVSEASVLVEYHSKACNDY